MVLRHFQNHYRMAQNIIIRGVKSPQWVFLVIIICVAVFFRFYHLSLVPPGLYLDEAVEGNAAATSLATGQFKVFYAENNGREGLFVNLVALSFKLFGQHIWSLRMVSAIAGVVTVLGLYFLAKQFFNWQIAAFSSYFLAISFWHVNFSRIGFRAILAPLCLVLGVYFFWMALTKLTRRDFILSAIFWGLGFYTYIAFRIMPLLLIIMVATYIVSIKVGRSREDYKRMRNKILTGSVVCMVIIIVIALPLGVYFLKNPGDFYSRTSQVSLLSSENPTLMLRNNVIKTMEMFFVAGDTNWRHNIAGSPELLWPIGLMFLTGFIRRVYVFFRPKNSNNRLVSIILLAWFFISLLPVVFSNEGIPHALRSLLVVPSVMIFAGEGLWLAVVAFDKFLLSQKMHSPNLGWLHNISVVTAVILLTFLLITGIIEYNKYFHEWAENANTADWFNQSYVDLANRLNSMSPQVKKYVLLNTQDGPVNGLPIPAQTIMFVTNTQSNSRQQAKNLYYLTWEDYCQGLYDHSAMVFPLEKSPTTCYN